MKDKHFKWKVNNCLFFAIWRSIKNDKYIIIRKTRRKYLWPFCRYHFLVIPKDIVDKYAESYVPKKDDLGKLPLPWFRGYIKKGDKKD